MPPAEAVPACTPPQLAPVVFHGDARLTHVWVGAGANKRADAVRCRSPVAHVASAGVRTVTVLGRGGSWIDGSSGGWQEAAEAEKAAAAAADASAVATTTKPQRS